MARYLTTTELKAALGVKHVQQVDRWAAKWGLTPCSPPGRRPRQYLADDFLDAYQREQDARTRVRVD